MDRYFSSVPHLPATRFTIARLTHAWPLSDSRGLPQSLPVAALTWSRTWIENSTTRRRLLRCQGLDPRFAKDIALSPAEIAAECAQPFWRHLGLSREEAASRRKAVIGR